MGYRSEVCIIVQMDRPEKPNEKHSDKTIKDWHLFISELKVNPKCEEAMKILTAKDSFMDYGGIDMKNCSLCAHFEYVKWRDGDEWIGSFNYLFGLSTQYCNDAKFGMSACFLRVGENGDVERNTWGEEGDDLAYITSPTIEMDWNAFNEKNKLLI
jgi:hypothetical protein